MGGRIWVCSCCAEEKKSEKIAEEKQRQESRSDLK